MNPRCWPAFLLALLTACGPSAPAAPSGPPSASPVPTPSASVYSPPNLPPAPAIHPPPGFGAYVYARDLRHPTAMAFGPDGRLYVTEADGRLVTVPFGGSPPDILLDGLATPLGLAWRGEELFVSLRGKVLAYRLTGNRLAGGSAVVQGLPTGRHQNDNLLMLPDGDFLLGVGSTCDVCREVDPRSASVLRFHRDWSYAGVAVHGSRNPYGLALRPSNGVAYVTINGQDNLGPGEPADHLLRVRDGADGGWPRCWPSFRDGTLHGNCAGVTPPVALFAPHSSADGIVFYNGTAFPAEHRDNAFVAEWGANEGGSVGRRVVRVVLSGSEESERGSVTDFATGFDHPLAVAIGPDGGLLVADYGTGLIIEIAPSR